MREILLGSWEAHGTIYNGGPGQEQTGGIGWYKRYTFKQDGTYTFDAYPPLESKGKWIIVHENGLNVLVLTLIDADGREQNAGRFPVAVDGNTLSLSGGNFNRVLEQK